VTIGQLATLFYFSYFLFVIPSLIYLEHKSTAIDAENIRVGYTYNFVNMKLLSKTNS